MLGGATGPVRDAVILNAAGEGICGMDREGKSTFVNPAVAKLTGWPLEELIGKTEEEIFGCTMTEGPAAPAGQVEAMQQSLLALIRITTQMDGLPTQARSALVTAEKLAESLFAAVPESEA